MCGLFHAEAARRDKPSRDILDGSGEAYGRHRKRRNRKMLRQLSEVRPENRSAWLTQLRRALQGLAVVLAVSLALGASVTLAQEAEEAEAAEEETYEENEILEATENFFGATTEGLAEVVEKIFADQGRPNAYIAGEEISGAIGIGVRYGKGDLNRKAGGSRKVYWQGPSIGFDLGGNASKVFVLIYHLPNNDALFQRFPAVEGSIYVVAGVGANYHQSGDIILAPIRTGVGLRAGVNVGYMHYTRKKSWIPL
jgi:hypothetical protein